MVQEFGRSALDDPAVAHDRDLVGHGQGLRLVVGDQDGGGAVGAQGMPHVLAQSGPQCGVECVEGLVEEDDRRPGRERPGNRDALLLPAGEVVRHAVLESGQTDEVQDGGGPAGPPCRPVQAVGDVAEDGQVREEGALLGDHGDAPPLGRHRGAGGGHGPAVDADLALVRRLEAGDAAQQRGLARAGGAEHGRQRAGSDGEVHPGQCLDAPIGLPDIGDVQFRHVSRLPG